MALLERLKGYILTVLICAMLFGGYLIYDRSSRSAPMQIIIPTATVVPTDAPFVVDVVGAVASPGVYTVPAQSRWQQAIEAAGGLTADADRMRINLAEHVLDGQQVVVPEVGATPLPTLTSCPTIPELSESTADRVDINSASIAELEQLPCIGPTLAQRIVSYREERGPFGKASDIVNVSGIGSSTYQKLEHLITAR